MELRLLFADTVTNDYYFKIFKEGGEAGLRYVYHHVYRALLRQGKRIIEDNFTAENIVHEAILKAWQFRDRMESMYHIYCFMRLNVRWKCYAYYRSPVNNFHRRLIYTDSLEQYAGKAAADTGFFDEERLKLIEEAIPYLPANRRTIVTLYFKYGFSYKTIANRFNASHQAIHVEAQKSLDYLKKIIHAKKKLETTPATKGRSMKPFYGNRMNAETEQIFTLRYEEKLSFAAIAEKMNLSQSYIQQQYIKAHQKIKAIKASD